MSYLYASNIDTLDRRTQLEIQLDNGSTALLRMGHFYDLTTSELARARQFIVLTSSSNTPDEEPIGITFLPIKGNPADGQIPVFDANEGVFVPVDAPSGVGAGPTTWTQVNNQVVVALTDAATIAVDARLGNVFKVTIAGNRTMGAPVSPVAGQVIRFRIKQDATGSRTMAWNAVYRFSDDIPTVTLSTIAGRTDYVAFGYNADDARWDVLGVVKGFV